MNYRLTFRFFNTKANKYMPAQYVDETTVFLLARLGGDKYIIEQCTGLKDKNGNLIYEGDIVELTDDDSFEKPIKTIVRWAEENACFGLFGSHNLYSSYDSDNFEVIGNIHENPELLEDK